MRAKASSKDKIIEVASTIIKEQGLEACTVRNISSMANVALGTIYNYYPSRDGLLEDVFIASWTNTKNLIQEEINKNNNVKTKAMNVFNIIGNDVNSRNGLGMYVISKKKLNSSELQNEYNFFYEIIELLISLLKESKKTKKMSDKKLETIAIWIFHGQLKFLEMNDNIEEFYNVVIDTYI